MIWFNETTKPLTGNIPSSLKDGVPNEAKTLIEFAWKPVQINEHFVVWLEKYVAVYRFTSKWTLENRRRCLFTKYFFEKTI
jgi:hypothetical protein